MPESIVTTHLRDAPRFVGYTSEKVPINPETNGAASVSNPFSWATYGEARAWADRTGGHVGFIPQREMLVIDFDDVFQAGQVDPWVHAQIDAIGAETERSCSGEGIQNTVPMDDALRALLPTKRVITSDQLPLEKVELIVGFNGVILGTPLQPALRAVPEQQAAAGRFVAELLSFKPSPQPSHRRRRSAPERAGARREATGEIRFDVNIVLAARAHRCERTHLGYLWMRTREPDAQGFVLEDDLRRDLTAAFTTRGHKHPLKAAKRLLHQVIDHGFAERQPYGTSGWMVIRFRAPLRLAARLGTELGATKSMPLAECLSLTPRR